jgi:hypothetical protein
MSGPAARLTPPGQICMSQPPSKTTPMKSTRRRPAPSNCRAKGDVSASASLAGAGELKADAFVVPGLRHKHGGWSKTWRPRQYASAAIRILYPSGLPPDVNQTKLVKDVNTYLRDNDPHFATVIVRVDRLTVLRAAGLMKP